MGAGGSRRGGGGSGGNSPRLTEEERVRAVRIGRVLWSARVRAGRSQEQCADRVGLSHAQISMVERGKALLAAVHLEILAEYLAIPAHIVWPATLGGAHLRKAYVQAQPGETVVILVGPEDADLLATPVERPALEAQTVREPPPGAERVPRLRPRSGRARVSPLDEIEMWYTEENRERRRLLDERRARERAGEEDSHPTPGPDRGDASASD